MIKWQPNQEFGVSPFATPDPARPGCRVSVSLADFTFDEIPTIGTRYGDAFLQVTRKNTTWDDHKFAGVMEGPKGWVYFMFNPPTANPTQPFRSYSSSEPYTWPAVLKDLGAVITSRVSTSESDEGFDSVIFNGARYAYTDPVPLDSEVLVEEFLSDEPFSVEFSAGEEPVPTPIDAKVYDGRVSFPACLHPEIEIPAYYDTVFGATSLPYVVSFVDFVPKNSTLDFNTPQKFARTNFLSWAPFTKPAKVRVTETNMYHAIKVTYQPPPINPFAIR